jgi:hypothetical protein
MPESMEEEILRQKGIKPKKEQAEEPKQKWGEARAKRFAGQHPNVMSFLSGAKKIGGIMAKPAVDHMKREGELLAIKRKSYHEALKKEIPKAAKEAAKADAKKIFLKTGHTDFNDFMFGPAHKPETSGKKITIEVSDINKKKRGLFGDDDFLR